LSLTAKLRDLPHSFRSFFIRRIGVAKSSGMRAISALVGLPILVVHDSATDEFF
jgi:hypothetical protein